MEKNFYAKLSNGVQIPWVGLGTYLSIGDEMENAIKIAFSNGYMSIDTATAYCNESEIGKAIKEIGLEKHNIYITSKLWNNAHGYDNALRAFDNSEKMLGYIDSYLIHWPGNNQTYVETWKAFERIYEEKRVKAIGVSNFLTHHLDILLANCNIAPMINQIETHVFNMDYDTINYCKDREILIEAWGPLMRGLGLIENTTLVAIGKKYNKSSAQIALRFLIQKGIRVIPKSIWESEIKENIDLFDFTILPDDMCTIEALNVHKRVGPHPDKFFLIDAETDVGSDGKIIMVKYED